ncbi:uncharacterized protein LOC142578358 [Dermacentor variabilis]|uniref:uncharacterized protein LOC142578358 n=1 Tax=Dermacentor variabilis TaxID=34621 RepID=UPI003F5B8D23
MCSDGAVFAAMNSRGNRNAAPAEREDYEFILPTLPTGRTVLNTIFLHADIRARPYRVEDFKDTLDRLALLPEVLALGAYQMSHVWAVTFKNAEGVKKALTIGEMKVKGRRCVVVDPANQALRLKLHWLLFNVPDEDVRAALAMFGKVTDVVKEKWRVNGIHEKSTTTRTVSIQLHPGVKVDDLPHQLRVGGELALLIAPGRAPVCLRCHAAGHIRRDCRVPRCARCRRFGHDESSCVKTYASVTGPVGKTDAAELVMDEADAEEAAGTSSQVTQKEMRPADMPSYPQQNEQQGDHSLVENPDVREVPEKTSGSAEYGEPSKDPASQHTESMDVTVQSTGGAVGKRGREATTDDEDRQDVVGSVEPPTKTVATRRASLKPKPNVPPDRKAVFTPST